MSQPKSSRLIGAALNWMATAASQGQSATPEQIRSWCEILADAESCMRARELAVLVNEDDAMVTKPGDRLCAADAEFILDSTHALVKRLAYHAGQAATRAELAEIDNISSSIIDATKTLATGIARPSHHSQTGA